MIQIIWVENLPAEVGLHHLQVTVGSSLGTVCYIGPPDHAGLQQINVMLPVLEATGLLPVEVLWLAKPIAPDISERGRNLLVRRQRQRHRVPGGAGR